MEPKRYQRFCYTEATLQEALNLIREGKISLNKAHKDYGIPKGTLHNKLKEKVPRQRKMGPPTVLTEQEENKIEEWILQNAKVGFPLHPDAVRDSVQKILKSSKRPNPFTNSRPGVKWFNLFLKRHKHIVLKNAEVISKSRATVNEESIRKWFSELEIFLRENNCFEMMEDPSRIMNCDETGVQTCPKSGKLLGPKNMKNFYEVVTGSEKESITVLCTFNANGERLPPMVIFPFKRLPTHIINNMFDDWAVGRSDTGWMVSSTFYEYVANVLHPWLLDKKVQFPVILFLDGHKSHLSIELADFCREKGIHLYCLPPNATHIIQPCDVAIFKPLKSYWKKACQSHRSEKPKVPINKTNFTAIFKTAFDMISTDTIKNAFRVCGLFPFDPNSIDYSKCMPDRYRLTSEESVAVSSQSPTADDYKTAKRVLDYVIGQDNLGSTGNNELKEIYTKIKKRSMIRLQNLNDDTSSDLSSVLDIQSMPMEIDGVLFPPSDVFNAFENNYDNSLHDFDISDTFENIELFNPVQNEQKKIHILQDIILKPHNTNTPTQLPSMKENTTSEEKETVKAEIRERYNAERVEAGGANSNLEDDKQEEKENKTEKNEELELPREAHYFQLEKEECQMKKVEEKEVIQETQSTDGNAENEDNNVLVEEEESSDELLEEKNNVTFNLPLDEKKIDKPNTTPEKDQLGKENENAESSSVNDLWTKHLSWPRLDDSNKKKKSKENKVRMPYAITSKKWKEIQEKKESERLEKQRLIEKKREARKKRKLEPNTKKDKTQKRKVSVDDEIGSTLDKKMKTHVQIKKNVIEIEGESWQENPTNNRKEILSDSKYNAGDYVIVQYENSHFPGVIKNIRKAEYKVSVMWPCGDNKFKWPLKRDLLWYKFKSIKEKINIPQASNDLFSVPEMKKYANE